SDSGLVRLKEEDKITPGNAWWEQIDLANLPRYTVGGLLWLLSKGKIDPDAVMNFVNPANWWTALFPQKWAKIVSSAWNLENWTPLPTGAYWIDMLFRGGQSDSAFERNAGANSGSVYQTVLEVEKDEIYVGEFTRVVGADQPFGPSPAPTAVNVTFSISDTISLQPGVVWSGPDQLDPNAPPHQIDFDIDNRTKAPPQQVVNGSGFYFHAFVAKTYKIDGTGSNSGHKESVEIEVKDLEVGFKSDVFICENQTIRIEGDGNATYRLRVKTNNSGFTLNNRTYTAGDSQAIGANKDEIEIIANYDGANGVFKTYRDNRTAGPPPQLGLAEHDYVVKTIAIAVQEPTITPDATEVFVGGVVAFAANHNPRNGNSTTNVPGSQFNVANMQFIAGKGPIAAEATETITLDYGCKQYTFDIKVKPITATISPTTVDGGGTAQINVVGGVAPYRYAVSVPNSTGPQVDANGRYTAGSENTQVTDTITITDRNGDGGRARVEVTVRPMTVSPASPSVQVNNSITLVASSGVTPFTFEITNRESNGSTIANDGRYTAGSTPGTDTITITDSKGTRITATVAVTA
ncbi:MAG: hypothetical protein ACE5I1_24425, partial [bacterium]